MFFKIYNFRKHYLIAALINFWLILSGCKEEEKYVMTGEDSLRVMLTAISDSLEKKFLRRPPAYKLYHPKGGVSYSKLVNRFGQYNTDIILELNRIDSKHLKRRDTLVVPDTFVTNRKYYSPFPLKVEAAFQIPKLIVVSQKIQAFAAYQLGDLILWGPTSTGKEETPTPNGLFHTNWKAEETKSTFDDEWILKWNFNLDNFEGVALHQYELPGYPASHSCVRLLERDAKWIYNWAEQWIVTEDEESVLAYGTPVIIFDEYDFDSSKPWHELVNHPESAKVSLNDLEDEIEDYINLILQRKKQRNELIAIRDSIKIVN